MRGISLAGEGLDALLGAGGIRVNYAVIPVVTECRNSFRLNKNFTADRALYAGCLSVLFTGRGNGGDFFFRVSFRFNRLGACVRRISLAGEGDNALLGAGGIRINYSLVPVVTERRNSFRLNKYFSADRALYAGCLSVFFTGRENFGNFFFRMSLRFNRLGTCVR